MDMRSESFHFHNGKGEKMNAGKCLSQIRISSNWRNAKELDFRSYLFLVPSLWYVSTPRQATIDDITYTLTPIVS